MISLVFKWKCLQMVFRDEQNDVKVDRIQISIRPLVTQVFISSMKKQAPLQHDLSHSAADF